MFTAQFSSVSLTCLLPTYLPIINPIRSYLIRHYYPNYATPATPSLEGYNLQDAHSYVCENKEEDPLHDVGASDPSKVKDEISVGDNPRPVAINPALLEAIPLWCQIWTSPGKTLFRPSWISRGQVDTEFGVLALQVVLAESW